MRGLACATETLMICWRFAKVIGYWIFVLLSICLNQFVRHVLDCTSIFAMGVIDYRDESSFRSATVVYILRVLNESII